MGARWVPCAICPHEGELPLLPICWNGSSGSVLFSFRLIGHPEFYGIQEGQRSWRAYRTFHGQNYKQSLGTTDRLMIARLEEVAGTPQIRPT